MEYVLVGLFVGVLVYVVYRNNVKNKSRGDAGGTSDRTFRDR